MYSCTIRFLSSRSSIHDLTQSSQVFLHEAGCQVEPRFFRDLRIVLLAEVCHPRYLADDQSARRRHQAFRCIHRYFQVIEPKKYLYPGIEAALLFVQGNALLLR